MFRVVTVRYLREGMGRRRVVNKGPLHPDEQTANRWAQYLRYGGEYAEVRVETGSSTSASRLHNGQHG